VTAAESPLAAGGLRRNCLSALENVAQALGTMAPTGTIGVILPLLIGKSGNATWLLLLVTLVVFILIALNITVFATRDSSAGGLGTYVRDGLGPRAGLAASWCYVVGLTLGAASAAPSAAYYAGIVIGHFSGGPASLAEGAGLTGLVILVAGWTAVRGIKLSSDLMLVIEFSSLAVIGVILACALRHSGAWVDRPQLRLEGVSSSAVALAFAFSFMTLGGFESVTTLGEEARHATRVIPRVILGCLLPLGILYVGVTYALVGLARRHHLALDQLDAPFDTLAGLTRIPTLGIASSVGIALSFFACTLGSLNAAARTLFALARDGRFARSFGEAHPRNATPHRAIALLGLIALVASVGLVLARVSLIDTINYTAQVSAFGYIGAYFLVCLAAPFFLQRRHQLRAGETAVAAGALLILSIVLALSVFPVPAAPWCYLPYLFLLLLGAGMAISLIPPRRGSAASP
jgi:amino acid transporter